MSLFTFIWKKSKLTLCFLSALTLYALFLAIRGEGWWGLAFLTLPHAVLWPKMLQWKKDLEAAEQRERDRLLSLAKFAITPKYRSSSIFMTSEALLADWEFTLIDE